MKATATGPPMVAVLAISSWRRSAAASQTWERQKWVHVPGAGCDDSAMFRGKVRSGALQGGGARLSAHQKRSPQPYLHAPNMYFDAHCNHSLPGAKVSSETAQRTRWAPRAFELYRRALTARCTQSSSTIGSAAQRRGADPTGAQPIAEAANGLRMAIYQIMAG